MHLNSCHSTMMNIVSSLLIKSFALLFGKGGFIEKLQGSSRGTGVKSASSGSCRCHSCKRIALRSIKGLNWRLGRRCKGTSWSIKVSKREACNWKFKGGSR